MNCGIYKITNKINGHYYVGQSVDIKKRFREHAFAAAHEDCKDHNTPIHLAMSKYGKENFILEILEECLKDELDNKEIYWINKLEANKNGNYNILKGGQDRIKFDEKPVELYDLQGNYIKTIPSATKVAQELGISRNTVYQVLYKQRPTCKNYQLKYEEDKDTKIGVFQSKQGGGIKINQLDPISKKIIKTYISAAEAGRQTGADSSTIIKVCKGKLKTTKGYAWSYATDEEVI